MRNFINIVEGQSSTLYHGTSLWSFLLILGSDMMKGGNDNDLVGDFNEPGVSFTTELSIAYRYGKDRAYNDLSTLQEICGDDLRTNDLKTIVVMHFDRASEGFQTYREAIWKRGCLAT